MLIFLEKSLLKKSVVEYFFVVNSESVPLHYNIILYVVSRFGRHIIRNRFRMRPTKIIILIGPIQLAL